MYVCVRVCICSVYIFYISNCNLASREIQRLCWSRLPRTWLYFIL